MLSTLLNILRYVVWNFGPLLAFYLINRFWGFQIGIAVSLIWIVMEFVWKKFKRQELSRFFYVSSSVIFVFGLMDLFIQNAFFIKYESFLLNALFAGFFALSLRDEKPIVQVIAEGQGRTSTENSVDKTFFFRLYTVIWSLYFLVKGIVYLWINLNNSLEDAFLIRVLIGNISFAVMMFFSIVIPRQVWNAMEKLKVFPSQRS